MTTTELLAELDRRGVVVWVEGDRIRYLARRGALTPELRRAMVERKADLLWLIPPEPPSLFNQARLLFGGVEVSTTAKGACHVCGGRQWWRSVHGALVCMRCHPPAVAELVAGVVEG